MNVSYTYIDGKAIIFDENGNQVPVEYYNNLDEVLIQENVIETIENEIKCLGNIKTLPKKKFIPIITIGVAIAILIAPLILSLISGSNLYTTYVDTILGKISFFKMIVIICGVTAGPLALICDIANHQIYNDFVKYNNAKTYELEFLKKQLVVEKQKLSDLKKEKTKEIKDSNFEVVKVNDIEQLKKLKHYINLYYSLGYDIEKLYKFLGDGTLEEKLSESYNSEDIQLAKAFLEENGPSLIKKL